MSNQDTKRETPWRREPEELGQGLGRWASEAIGPDARIEDLVAPDNGMSSESILFDVVDGSGGREHYVARLAPLPSLVPVFPTYDIELQARCMRLVGERTDVPAPQVPFLVQDESFLQVPFLVMERIDGRAPSDMPPYVFGGWVADLGVEDRARMERNAVEVLARLHTITPANADLAFLERPDRGESALDQHLGHERWYYEWARAGERYPLIERTFDWLEANRPTEGETVLNWGDARIGNMLWRGIEPVAVLDWEMASVGPREIDLAWMQFLGAFFQDMAERYGMPGLPDFMQRQRMIDTYSELTGHQVADLGWFEVFAALRFAIVSVRTSTRGIQYGTSEKPEDPDDLIMFRPLLEQMLEGTYWD